MAAPPFRPTNEHLRRRYTALLQGDVVIDDDNNVIDSDYERWRELKRMVIVYGLPRDNDTTCERTPADTATSSNSSSGKDDALDADATAVAPSDSSSDSTDATATCSLRGRLWKLFLGVDATVDSRQYEALAARGASYCDSDIRNDTFRTFRGDPAFAQRVPEEKLARLLNVFIHELGAHADGSESIRYVQGMNVLCAPLLYVMPEADAYHTFRQLIVRHCPHYMAPKLQGVETGCLLVDKCLLTLDADLFHHLQRRGITARIYALPLILSLFACAPPLPELLRVWDVLFAVGVHFVVVLVVAHTVLLRDELLHKDMDLMKILSVRFLPPLQSDLLVSVALQLLHRLPDDLIFEIARHPFEHPESTGSLPLPAATVEIVLRAIRREQQTQSQQQQQTAQRGRPQARASLPLNGRAGAAAAARARSPATLRAVTAAEPAALPAAPVAVKERKRDRAAAAFAAMRPRWKF